MHIKKYRLPVKITTGFLAFCFFLSLVMRIIDGGFFYYGGVHVNNAFWMNITAKENLSFLNIPLAIGLICGFSAAIAGFIYALLSLKKWSEQFAHKTNILLNLKYTVACLITANIIGGISYAYLIHRYTNDHVFKSFGMSAEKRFLRLFPEKEFIKSFNTFYLNVPEITVLDDATVSALKNLALNPDQKAQYPFMKKSIRISNAPSGRPQIIRRPNIIIIAFESLSTNFTEMADGKELLMPNINRFINTYYSFPNMTNSGAPTVNGMLAILGSSVFVESSDINDFSQNPVRADLLFLSEILKKKGYSTTHIQGVEGAFSNFEPIMRKNGYDRFYSPENIEVLEYIKLGIWKWGLHDDDTFFYAEKIIDEDKKISPFFLTISTNEAHFPYDPPEIYGDGSDRLLNAMRSADSAFGRFMKYFYKSPIKDNTIIIITADHAFHSRINMNSLPDSFGISTPGFDRVPLAIYLPGNRTLDGRKNDAKACSLDITPTILDLLDIDTENSFMGISLFSDAQFRKIPFGRIIFGSSSSLNGYTQTMHDSVLNYIRYLDFNDLMYKEGMAGKIQKMK
jgi:phosphoglycerol transferase MdoB-like AlkP superfamily enzyme